MSSSVLVCYYVINSSFLTPFLCKKGCCLTAKIHSVMVKKKNVNMTFLLPSWAGLSSGTKQVEYPEKHEIFWVKYYGLELQGPFFFFFFFPPNWKTALCSVTRGPPCTSITEWQICARGDVRGTRCTFSSVGLIFILRCCTESWEERQPAVNAIKCVMDFRVPFLSAPSGDGVVWPLLLHIVIKMKINPLRPLMR